MSSFYSCGNNFCGGSVPSCGNPFLVCPATSIVLCLQVTNSLGCPVNICLTLSDGTTTSVIIPGLSGVVTLGPYTSGSGCSLTITLLQAVVVSACSLSPLYNNTIPQTDGTSVAVAISSTGLVFSASDIPCV